MKVKPVRSVRLCPFDSLPCAYVDCCDDVLSLYFGFDMVEGGSCSRAVYKAVKK
jgi:hypothetical protein